MFTVSNVGLLEDHVGTSCNVVIIFAILPVKHESRADCLLNRELDEGYLAVDEHAR